MITISQIVASAALGALIGFGTNWLAIKSLFRPLRPRWYSLGWQGVIPRNKEKLANNISKVVGTDLLARDYLLEQLQNATLQNSLHRFVAAQIDRLLSASLASGFAQLPSDWRGEGLDKATRRLIEWMADWSESKSGLELKQWLLDALEARLGALRVEQVLSAKQLDEFIDMASGVLAKRETREHLTRTLQERLEGYLGSDTPLEQIVPAELRDVLHDRLQREIPEILVRIARWLKDPENVESLVERILKALEAYAGQANWLKSLIANLGLHFFREEITQALHQRIPQLAREFLHSEEVREKFAKQLIDSVNDLLRKPVAEVVGEHRHILAQRVGSIAATWISSKEAQEALGSFLRHQYRQHRERQLDEVVPERVRRTVRQRLSKALRLPRDKIEIWSMQLSAFLRERLQHSRAPLREWTDLRQDDEKALVQWAQDKATKVMETQVPVLIARFDIQSMVYAKIMKFDLLRVERLIKGIISDQLRYINLLGAVLGGLVGVLLPFLNAFIASLH